MEEPAPTQPAHTCTTEYKRWWADWPSVNHLVGTTHQRETQHQPKTKDIHRVNIKHRPRSVSSGNQGDCNTESHRYSTTEVYIINSGSQNRATEEAEANRKSLTNNGKTKKQFPNEKKGDL